MQLKALVILLVIAALCSSAFADEIKEIKKSVRSNSREERLRAYAKINSLEPAEKQKVLPLVFAEYKKWADKYQRASSKIKGFLKGYEKSLDKKEALREKWEKAAREAMMIIFDKAVFPDPPGPVSGPYIGYYEVMDKVEPARKYYKKFHGKVERDLKPFFTLSRATAEKIRDEFVEAKNRAAELEDQLSRHGKTPGRLDELERFYQAMLFLKCEQWKIASKFFYKSEESLYIKEEGKKTKEPVYVVAPGPPLSGYEQALFFFFYARQVDEYNFKVTASSSKNERNAVAKNNDYRISLGLCPLLIHPDVTRAITEHLSTVKEMSHIGATPETETVGQRIRKAGYAVGGGAAENLAMGSLFLAMDLWKWDGGHHRVLVEPGAVHIGVCEKNHCGMNIATGERSALPVFDYLDHFGQ